MGRELADIGVNGAFSGAAVIGALFQGGKLSYSYLVDGEKIFVTAYLPTAIGVLLTLCIALFLALFLYQAALVVLFRKRGEDNAARLNAIGGWAGIGLGFLCLVVYALLITLNIPTTYLVTAGLEDVAVQAAFYKVFSPSVIWLVLCPVCIVAGMIQRKIDSAQVVLLKRYIPSYLFMVFPLLLIAVFNLYPIVLQTVLSFKDYSLGTGIFNSPWVGMANFKEIFLSPEMLRVIGNTLYISLLKLIGATVPPLLLSIFLYDMRMMRAKKVVPDQSSISRTFSVGSSFTPSPTRF